MTFGEEWGFGAGKPESRRMYDAFLDAGGNFIDTANTYSNGTSETFLGEFIGSDRDRIVLASKYSNTISTGNPNAGGNSRKAMVESLHASLKRLNTDYIDLYWLHISRTGVVNSVADSVNRDRATEPSSFLSSRGRLL